MYFSDQQCDLQKTIPFMLNRNFRLEIRCVLREKVEYAWLNVAIKISCFVKKKEKNNQLILKTNRTN